MNVPVVATLGETAMTDGCHLCDETEALEQHHIVPRRFGGSDESENLVDLCPTCHSKLEKLYNKRFYDELGVEKVEDTKKTISLECANDGCHGSATRKVSIRGEDDSLPLCDNHDGCSVRFCGDKAQLLVKRDDGGYQLLCDEHAVCQNGTCSATDVTVHTTDAPGYSSKVLCHQHAEERRV